MNIFRVKKLMHHLATRLRRQLKPLSQRLRNRLADRLRNHPFGRRLRRRPREIQLEFHWNSKF
jgi:hypothetical protein